MKQLFLFLLLLSFIQVNAQRFEISTGYSINKMTGIDGNGFEEGIYVNMGYKFPMNNEWGIRPMLSYIDLGSDIEFRDEGMNKQTEIDVSAITFGGDIYHEIGKMEISAGLHYAIMSDYGIPSEIDEFVFEEEEVNDETFSNNDLMLNFKARYSMQFVFLELAFRQGLLQQDDITTTNLNTGLGLGVGLRF